MANINVPATHVPEGEFTAIERRVGIIHPQPADFPPVHERVKQHKDPFGPIGDQVIRVTYEGNEVCNLSCPGCYIGDWLRPDGEHRNKNKQRFVDPDRFDDHLAALPNLNELYYIGAEAAAAPAHSNELFRRAKKRGVALMGITNGANSISNTDKAFREHLDDGSMHKLVISLDSVNSATNDTLRGKKGATAATLRTIDEYIGRGILLKVQATVWPQNYGEVLKSTRILHEEHGVTGFGFHYGSAEPFKDKKQAQKNYVNPMAWRALAEQLLRFRDANADTLDVFYFPYTYYTEKEMRDYIIGDPALADAYFAHEAAGQTEPMPFVSCVQSDPEQVYLFANDGDDGTGKLSLCNIHTIATDLTQATFDPTIASFVPHPTGSNQLEHMLKSPNFCPAMPQATGGLHATDKYRSEEGIDLYHACRYPGVNQVPQTPEVRAIFSDDIYHKWARRYAKLSQLAVRSESI